MAGRPKSKSVAPRSNHGPQTLAGFNLGYNGYANPAMLSWQQWFDVSNIYSGQHARIIRARFGQVVNLKTVGYSAQQQFFTSLFNFRDNTPQEVVLGDTNGKMFSFNTAVQYQGTQRFNPYIDPNGNGDARLNGPWSRTRIFNICFEMNGTAKQTGRGLGAATIEGWGLDSPDSSPGINFSAGAITKAVGRSYAFAWENIGKFNVGAPSPTSAYVYAGAQQNSQGTIQCIEPGFVSTVAGSSSVAGSGAAVFTAAWIGKNLWIAGIGNAGLITDVSSSTQLTLIAPVNLTVNAQAFMIYDQQATHVRLYATADGGATYFRIQRNQFLPTATDLATAGLQFTDNDNTEPGQVGTSFTTELAQFQNVPPPIGKFVYEYQSRAIIFGVPAALQTLFYTNIENTIIGDPPECCGPQNQFTLPIGDASINGCAGMPTGLVVWSDRHDMFKITGNLQDNGGNATPQQVGATIQRLPYTLGCGSALATMVTSLGAIWITADREIFLFTDTYAPRNVGRPVQDFLSRVSRASLPDARAAHIKRDDLDWAVFAVAIDGAPFNNKLLILDLDMMASNGAPSFFVFDMSTNQPTWYLYDVTCESIEASFDALGVMHLLTGDTDIVRDVTFRDGYFAQSEDQVQNILTLHAIGNQDSHVIKELDWVRFITNVDASTMQADGWGFAIDSIEDDVYTFSQPKNISLKPGVNSVKIGDDAALLPGTRGVSPGSVQSRANEFSPAKFATRGIKQVMGRRFLISITFPNKAGVNYELWAIQLSMTPKFAR